MTCNEKEITLTLSRIELCDLWLATIHCFQDSGDEKWVILCDKIQDIIYESDCLNFIK